MEEQFLVLEMFVKVGEDIDIDADFVGITDGNKAREKVMECYEKA